MTGPKRKRITVAVDEQTYQVCKRMAEVSRQSVSSGIGDFLQTMAPFMDFMTDNLERDLGNVRMAGIKARKIFEHIEQEIKPHLEEMEGKVSRQ